jgi:formylglycine-generating enzyme required for sulfatase activity/serine/threonine protein kinase
VNLTDRLRLVGTIVAEKYAIDRVVGEGGFATVFRARHLLWKTPVALKVFTSWRDVPEESAASMHEAFLREGALLSELSSRTSAIVQARDVGILDTPDGGRLPYLVLEWIDGPTLEQILADEGARGLPPRRIEEAVRLLNPIGVALGLAHTSGIVHQDVKASNILIAGDPRGDGVVKLVDFGVAKVMSDVIATRPPTTDLRSMTPAYAAPEQFSPALGATGPWTDVFALALMIVEIVTGKDALEGTEYEALARASTNPDQRPTPRALGADVSDGVEAVFVRALAVRPEHRWQNAFDFWSALMAAVSVNRTLVSASMRSVDLIESNRSSFPATSGSVPPPPMMTPPGARSPSSRGAAAFLATSLAVGVVALGATWFARAQREAAPASAQARVTAPPASDGAMAATMLPSATQQGTATTQATSTTTGSAAAPSPDACPAEMVPIPGGEFFMGNDEGLATEKPSHSVTLAPYCMDKYEVSVSAYVKCSEVGKCKRAGSANDWDGITSKDHATFDSLCNGREPEERGNHPVNCVDWSMAERFCRETGKRLPTEAEWEFAARGPDGRRYPWGDDDPTAEYLNACGSECAAWGAKNHVDEKAMYAADDGFPTTAPVGSFPKGASRYGVEDVVGNVWEWVADWYAPYRGDEEANPKGPSSGEERVIRGGSWNGSFAAWVRPTFRFKSDANQRSYGIGFRCAK